jgi:putative PIN family toxin of toxin-antitoxin system
VRVVRGANEAGASGYCAPKENRRNKAKRKAPTPVARPRIVIDTNVIVAGLRSKLGWSYDLLSLVDEGYFEICLSTPVALEYEEVIKRLAGTLAVSAADLDVVLDFWCECCRRVEVHFRWPSCLPDPSDDAILELAVSGGCEYIVTFNKRHFGPAVEFGIRVMTPAEFIAVLGIEP